MAINIFGNASTILPFPLMFNIKASQDVFTGDLKRAISNQLQNCLCQL